MKYAAMAGLLSTLFGPSVFAQEKSWNPFLALSAGPGLLYVREREASGSGGGSYSLRSKTFAYSPGAAAGLGYAYAGRNFLGIYYENHWFHDDQAEFGHYLTREIAGLRYLQFLQPEEEKFQPRCYLLASSGGSRWSKLFARSSEGEESLWGYGAAAGGGVEFARHFAGQMTFSHSGHFGRWERTPVRFTTWGVDLSLVMLAY